MFSRRTDWKLATNSLTQAVSRLRSSGVALLDLTISNPTECGLNYDSKAILASLSDPRALSYDPQPQGLLSARESVAGYYQRDRSLKIDPASILLTTSTSEAYNYLFWLLCNDGDEVLIPKPSYPLFDFLADLADVALVPYPIEYAHGWMIDFQTLSRAITERTRAILLVHPNNPTGSYVQREEVAQLNRICQERNLALIVDEVFLDYAFERGTRTSFVGNQAALTFTLSGLSKTSALPQMKLAWMVISGPEDPARAALERLEVIADTYLSVNTPIQFALPALLEQRHAVQGQLRERILKNRIYLETRLRSSAGHSWGSELLHADGGWYAVLRTCSTQSDEEIVLGLLEKQHVLIHPGYFYDFPTENYLLLSLITPEKTFQDGLQRIFESF